MGLEYIPDCVMKEVENKNKKIRQLQRWVESHVDNTQSEHKQIELDRLMQLGVNEYYDRINHVPKRVRLAKIAGNKFIADFADVRPSS